MLAAAFQGYVSQSQCPSANMEQGRRIGPGADDEAMGAAFQTVAARAEALRWRVHKGPFKADRPCFRIAEAWGESNEIVPRVASSPFERVAEGKSGRVARCVIQTLDDELGSRTC